MEPRKTEIKRVLFDLDGTLLDTAPDLANALNVTLKRNGRDTLAFETIRPVVSYGGRALIQLGFNLQPDHPEFEPLRLELLDYYLHHIADQTTLFPGMENVLHRLEDQGMPWGIVTNKPGWLTEPLLTAVGLRRRAAVVVSGDTLKENKPHPAPLLYACEKMQGTPAHCLYVGDAGRDIEAGQRAGMFTLIAMFGYIMETDQPDSWNASGSDRASFADSGLDCESISIGTFSRYPLKCQKSTLQKIVCWSGI